MHDLPRLKHEGQLHVDTVSVVRADHAGTAAKVASIEEEASMVVPELAVSPPHQR